MRQPPQQSTLFPYTTLFRSRRLDQPAALGVAVGELMDAQPLADDLPDRQPRRQARIRSEEHTSELQSHHDLVCRLLLEKKNRNVGKIVLRLPEGHPDDSCNS